MSGLFGGGFAVGYSWKLSKVLADKLTLLKMYFCHMVVY